MGSSGHIDRYLLWLNIPKNKWRVEQAELLEMTFLSVAPRKRMTSSDFKAWLRHMSKHSLRLSAEETNRLWNRWKEIFQDSDLDTASRWVNLLERDHNQCRYCGSAANTKVKLHEHHVFPKSKGGAYNLANLVLACETCNWEIGNSVKFPKGWKFGTESS
jgi:hypothetical protein